MFKTFPYMTDDGAFTALYRKYFPRIYGYVIRRVGNREDAEDIVSQVFIKVVENLPNFSEKQGSFKSWIYKIATNTIIDSYRRFARRKYEPMESSAEIASPAKNPREELYMEDERIIIFQAISKLPQKYQEVLHLKFYSDMENEEIAEILGITVNHVAVRLHRALKKFQEIYNHFIEYG